MVRKMENLSSLVICFNICGLIRILSLYSHGYGTCLSFRQTDLLAAIYEVKEGVANYQILSFHAQLSFCSTVAIYFWYRGFAYETYGFTYGLSVLRKVQIFVLGIFQACMTCLLSFHPGQTSFSKTHISANFFALIFHLKSFFSLTFKHRSSFILPSLPFCCFDQDFML